MKVIDLRKGLGEKYTILIHLLFGIVIFYFLVHPLTMVIYWFEMNDTPFTISQFFEIAPGRMMDSFSFQMTSMATAFVLIGALVGLGSGLYYRNLLRQAAKLRRQDKLLKGSLVSIIREGESDEVEFKSSLRFDYHQNVINKSLEGVIIKTIAGFMNTKGGTLLIGLDDSGNILGLEQDYQSLKKKNRDGFELQIYQLITNDIGIEFCSLVDVDFYDFDEKDVCTLRIKVAISPAYVHSRNKTSFYIRTGNSTKPLTIQEAVKYINTR